MQKTFLNPNTSNKNKSAASICLICCSQWWKCGGLFSHSTHHSITDFPHRSERMLDSRPSVCPSDRQTEQKKIRGRLGLRWFGNGWWHHRYERGDVLIAIHLYQGQLWNSIVSTEPLGQKLFRSQVKFPLLWVEGQAHFPLPKKKEIHYL